MDHRNSDGHNGYHGSFEAQNESSRSAGSFRGPSSGTYRSREHYYERLSEPGKIDRPFTRRMQQEAERAAREPVSPPKKEEPKRKRQKRTRQSEERAFPRKYVFLGIAAALFLAVLLLMIFGEHGTHHDMPVITPPETEEETIGE